MKISWLEKISFFQENNRVEADLLKASGNNSLDDSEVISTFEGTASKVEIPSLKFGDEFRIRLRDTDEGQTFGPFVVQACK